MTAFSFFWHDYETFGRVPRRDRPAQFAGIRTDADLNEIGQPVMHYCRPSPDSLPDPESCLLTGIVPQTCLEQGLPEHAFAAEIEGALAQPGTIGVGYNTIRFDDEVTRHLFWRNLIDPYAREWQNECGRWDLLDVVRATWALRPEGIEWPRHEDGRPSFKLEHLTQANGIAHEAAHDALSDVRATIALARLIKTAPAAAVGLLPQAAPQGGRVGRDRRAPAVPAHLGHVRRGAGLHGHRLPAGAASHQQERAAGVGPGARPAGARRPRAPRRCASACSRARPTCPKASRGCRSRASTPTSRPSSSAT